MRELLNADYTFLNQPLAKFYGIDKEVKSKDAVELVEGANTFNRGGVLRMGAMLTMTSAPLRTSPSARRLDPAAPFWARRRRRRQPMRARFRATIRRSTARHSASSSRATNATPPAPRAILKIDPLGFPLESFDPVGRTRDKYLTANRGCGGEFADKTVISGADGLLKYLQRQDKQVTKMLARKMLGYALAARCRPLTARCSTKMAADGGTATFSDSP